MFLTCLEQRLIPFHHHRLVDVLQDIFSSYLFSNFSFQLEIVLTDFTNYSTVTDLARFLGLSISKPLSKAE